MGKLPDHLQGRSVSVSLCAQRNGLLSTPGWTNCKCHIRNVKVLARMANQVKLRSHRMRPKYKYGVQIPRSHKEAVWIDSKDGNTGWQTQRKWKSTNSTSTRPSLILEKESPSLKDSRRYPAT